MIPQLLVLDGRGDVIAGRLGYHSAQEILKTLKAVREGYGDYLRDVAAVDDFAACRRAAAFLVKLRSTPRARR